MVRGRRASAGGRARRGAAIGVTIYPSRLRHVAQHAGDDAAKRRRARSYGAPYAELGLGQHKWSDSELIDFMLSHPILINRPIVVTPKGVKLCRPSEAVLDLLPNPHMGRFIKEDGEVIGAA
jgi:arsenate reductase (glutaredoxin)